MRDKKKSREFFPKCLDRIQVFAVLNEQNLLNSQNQWPSTCTRRCLQRPFCCGWPLIFATCPCYMYVSKRNIDQFYSGFHSTKEHALTFWQMWNANDLQAHTTAKFEDPKVRKILARIFTLKTRRLGNCSIFKKSTRAFFKTPCRVRWVENEHKLHSNIE